MSARRASLDPGRDCAAPASVGAHVMAARQQLKDAGVSPADADLDARLIAQHVLGWTAERFLTSVGSIPPEGFDAAFRQLVDRRRAREPLAYVIGHREFWGLEMAVTAAVLVPRPETELLVESALDLLVDGAARRSIVDVGTGSGSVAIALARERPSATIVATDVSAAALTVARANAVRHGVADRVQLVRADLLAGVAGPFDAVVANPPYVPARDRPALQPEVARYEPALALFGGEDGLSIIRRLIVQAPAVIREGGMLMFEFGIGQRDSVTHLIAATRGLTLVDLRRDLQDIPRVAIARRV